MPGHDQAQDRAVGIRLLTHRANRMTYAQIAEVEGYADASGARMALLRALARHEAESAHELRTIENMALDTDERALRTIISNPALPGKDRVAAVNARTRLSARRARLNGLDAPVQIAVGAGSLAELDDALTLLEEIVKGQVVGSHELGPDDEPLTAGDGSPDRGPAEGSTGND